MRCVRYRDEQGGVREARLNEDATLTPLDSAGVPDEGAARVALPGQLLSPVQPPVILGVGLNYRSHGAELQRALPERPMLFSKLPGSVVGHGEPIRLPAAAGSAEVDYEGELGVVLDRPCRNVAVEAALDYVRGYTVANDVSARDWQFQWGGGQFTRAKSFDGFCPLGPCLVRASAIPDPQQLRLQTWVNGELRQEASTADMIHGVAALIAFLSQDTTLPAETLILTGTPGGVGHAREPKAYLKPGDTVRITIQGIGTLENPVIEAEG